MDSPSAEKGGPKCAVTLAPVSPAIEPVTPAGSDGATPARSSTWLGPAVTASRASFATAGVNGSVRFVTNRCPWERNHTSKVTVRPGVLVGPGLADGDPDGLAEGLAEGEPVGLGPVGAGPRDPALLPAHAAAARSP